MYPLYLVQHGVGLEIPLNGRPYVPVTNAEIQDLRGYRGSQFESCGQSVTTIEILPPR